MNKNILSFINLAINEAINSSAKHRHGAVAVYRNKVKGTGYNSTNDSSALQRLYARKAGKPRAVYNHAEVVALDSANLIADTLIVVRVNKLNNLANSKPCSICMELIKDSTVKKVYYSDGAGISCLRIRR